jgi:hypothetical protein
MGAVQATNKGQVHPKLRRRQWTAALVTVAVVVGGSATFSALVWPGFVREQGQETPLLPLTSVAELCIVTPEQTGEQTELVATFEAVVGSWVKTDITAFLDWQANEAAESWQVIYRDGSDCSVERQIVLTIGQWADSKDNQGRVRVNGFRLAQTFLATELTRTVETCQETVCEPGQPCVQCPLLSGQVRRPADREPYGIYNLFPVVSPLGTDGEALGEMWWRNGNVVVKIVGPLAELTDFYSAFPL